jgi:hypothetical protein
MNSGKYLKYGKFVAKDMIHKIEDILERYKHLILSKMAEAFHRVLDYFG